MGHQPYPSPARALHQLDRHHASPSPTVSEITIPFGSELRAALRQVAAAAATWKPTVVPPVKTCQHPGEQIDITTWADAAAGQTQLMCTSCGGVRSVPDPADTTEPPLSDPDGIVN
ncbi:hypothetical protein ABTY63_14980 [Streptomyces solisilvae]|uniref:hypothetical protein n=1 Tax=Streptomyces malaysiensis TaxID=92644 RepID=UPI00331E71A6